MPPISPEYSQLAHDFAAWAANIEVWQRAVESVIRTKLNLTDEDWKSALAQARATSGIPLFPESTTERLAAFLKAITRKP